MKPSLMVVGLVLLCGGLILMATVDWRLALGMFFYVWGNNLIYSARVQQFVNRATGRPP